MSQIKLISKIVKYKYALQIFILEFNLFVTEIGCRWGKRTIGNVLIFTYSTLVWSLMKNPIEIFMSTFLSTCALFRGGVCDNHAILAADKISETNRVTFWLWKSNISEPPSGNQLFNLVSWLLCSCSLY